MPWDVCKTLLNTQEPGVLSKIEQTEVRGLGNAAYVVWKTNRFPGFFKGLTPRVLYQVWQFHEKKWPKKLKMLIFTFILYRKNF